MSSRALSKFWNIYILKEYVKENLFYFSTAAAIVAGIMLGNYLGPVAENDTLRSIYVTLLLGLSIGSAISLFSFWKKIQFIDTCMLSVIAIVSAVSCIATFSELIGCLHSLALVLIFILALMAGNIIAWKLSRILSA